MIKLELPTDCQNYETVIDTCLESINITRKDVKERNLLYKDKIEQNKSDLIRISKIYIRLAKWNALFKYQYYTLKKEDLIKIGNHQVTNILTNDEMVKLYDKYFSKQGKLARKYYEAIINNAKNPNIQCPFCGGIGEPNELDHFLIKSKFGYYSIFPYNLIPICKDCNQKYKEEFYPKERNQQLIHPYLDDDCFFDEQWLFANIIIDFDDITLSTVKFYVNPPHHWSDDKKGKIQFHFDMFDLKKRYTIKSSWELSQVIRQIQEFKANGKLNEIDILACLISPVILDNRVNNWKKVLYEAIEQELSSIWNSI